MIDRTAWLEARRKGIGGTDAAAILGLSRYRSAIGVWEDKLGLSPERPPTAAMEWGRMLEATLATAYTETTGRAVRRVGMRRAHHVRDFPMIGSIDRMTYSIPSRPDPSPPRVVELKKKRSSDDLSVDPETPPEKRVPADWYVQVQHYMEVVEASVADVAVLVGGTDFLVIEIPRDPDFGADLRAEEGAFWRDYVLTETQPPVTADDLDYLARRYPLSAEEEKVATPDLAALVDEILDLGDQVKELERAKDERRAKVEEYLGEASKLLTPRASVSWKTQERNSVGWKEYAGSLERMVVELADLSAIDWMTGRGERGVVSREVLPFLPNVPAAYGPGLSGLRNLYSSSTSVRPFRVDRKKEGAK